jgi:large subunit ribosomal protein L24e
MEPCTFCGQVIPPGTGKMYVRKDARILYFCSRRCEKNLHKLGRNPRTTSFTAEAHKSKQQAMTAAAHAKAKASEPKTETPEAKPKKAPAKKAVKKAPTAPAKEDE